MRNSIRLSCGTSVFCHAALDVVGTSHGVDHAGELNESAVPGVLDDTSVMLSDFGIEKASYARQRLRWPATNDFAFAPRQFTCRSFLHLQGGAIEGRHHGLHQPVLVM